MDNDVAELVPRMDETGIRPTVIEREDRVSGIVSDGDSPTEEIEIEVAEAEISAAAQQPSPETPIETSQAPQRKTSVPPPPPAEALRVRSSTIPAAADLKARLRAPAPLGLRAALFSSGRTFGSAHPEAGTSSATAQTEALAAELERLSKRMRERDAYLAELEAVYSQRSEALLAAEAKLEAQAAELAARAARIAVLEQALRDRWPQPSAASEAADDLTRIRGVGPHYARLLQELGSGSFAAIAAWTSADCAQIGHHLKVNPGRIERDRWVEQARILLKLKSSV
jgi:predicted flap endonuclease-1-like 5' DNA nuclease